MPWCPTCDRFLSPPSVTPEGACPQCGQAVEAGRARPPGVSGQPADGADQAVEDEIPPVPLHMKILAASVVIYLGYRFIQGIEWVVHRF